MQKILVIDDEKPYRASIAVMLRRRGYEVFEAGSGVEGLRLALSHQPSLILSDVHMAGMDGFQLLEQLRAQAETSAVPVILMTGQPLAADVRRSMIQGADDYLQKPFTFDQMLLAVQARLRRQEGIELARKKERNQAADQLRLLTSALESAANSIVITSREGEIIWVNQAFTKLTGYAFAEAVGQNPRLLNSGQHPPKFYADMWATIATGNNWHGELVNRRKDGSLYFEEMTITPVRDADGEIQNYIAIKQDITERKQSEQALANERDLLRTLMDNSPDYVYFKDIQSRFTRINRAQARHLGLANPEAAIGKSDADFFPAHEARQKLVDERRMLATGEPIVGLIEQSDSTATTAWVSSTKVPIRGVEGNVTGLVGISRDITESKRAMDYLETSRQLLQILNEPGDFRSAIQRVVATLKAQSGFDAVGIRLQAGDDFPYLVQQGFSDNFLLSENTLIARVADGGVCRNKHGDICLECTCGLVISGRTDQVNPLFTPGGSFWTNDSFPLLQLPPDQDPRMHPRNVCIHHGYASVALIPIRNQNQIVGLLQLNDQRKGCFTLQLVNILEGIASHIGTALIRKQTEAALRESEQRYRNLFEHMNDGFARCRMIYEDGLPTDFVYLAVNEMFTTLTGLQAVIGRRVSEVIPGIRESDPDLFELYARVAANGKSERCERFVHALQMWFDISVYSPEPGIFVVVFDLITARKQMEASLRESEKKFRDLFELSRDAMLVVEVSSARFIAGNPAAVKLFRVKDEQQITTFNPWDLSPGEQPDGRASEEKGRAMMELAMREGAHQFEWTHQRADGQEFPADVLLTRMERDGQPVLLATVRDITERKRTELDRQLMEVQLRQSQKLESIGRLAAGIAHEINTPIQYVGDNTRFLKDSFEAIVKVLKAQDELLAASAQQTVTPALLARNQEIQAASDLEYLYTAIPDAIGETLEGVGRVSRIVRAMKEFSHPGGKEKNTVDLNKAIESTTTVARNEWKYVADLTLDLAPDLPPVPCYLGEFNQCILNLVVNAAHAIGDAIKANPGTKGLITVQTRRSGRGVAVRVSDTGTGIPEAVRPKIFEPFFTTKDVGQGTGQGLAMVYGTIVKRHGGTVTFETEVGKGTTFIIHLPLHAKADREAMPTAPVGGLHK